MKHWLKFAFGALLCTVGATTGFAQGPLVTVNVTEIQVVDQMVAGALVTAPGSGYVTAPIVTVTGGGGTNAAATAVISGGVSSVTLTGGGSGYTAAPTISFSGGGGSGAAATATLTGGVVTAVTINNSGSGYSTAPTVTFTPISGNTPATNAGGTAILNNVVSAVTITNPGTGYTSPPTLTFIGGGGSGAAAQAVLTLLHDFTNPSQNEAYGPAGSTINIIAQATGTFPSGGYTYQFFANGVSLGTAVKDPVTNPDGNAISWAPPLPGTYYISVTASGGPVAATSLPVRYFATGTALISPVDNTIVPAGSTVVIQAAATPAPVAGNAFVQRVDFYADGVLIGSDTTYPYSLIYTPAATPSTHAIEARAYDNNGNQISINGTAVRSLRMVTAIGQPPTVAITSPNNNATVTIGAAIPVVVSASSPGGRIAKVELYIDGELVDTKTGVPYTFSWLPSIVGSYNLVALAYDDKNNVVSASSSVNVTGNQPPSVTLTNPSTNQTVAAGAVLNLSASAGDFDGKVVSVRFLANGIVIGTAGGLPYQASWAPTAPGIYVIEAQATDDSGNITTSSSITVTVGGNHAPLVSITSPTVGAGVQVGTPVSIAATASDSDGVVSKVDFYANGLLIGTKVSPPYTASWTPPAEGVFHLIAVATDNGNTSATSADVGVLAASATGTTSANVYTGSYVNGKFALMSFGGKNVTLIGRATDPSHGKSYFYSDVPMDASGGFFLTNAGKTVFSGSVTAGAVSGTIGGPDILNGGSLFVGSSPFPPASGIGFAKPGYYTGSLTGRPGSALTAIVGSDSSIIFYVTDGAFTDVGGGLDSDKVRSDGTFSVTTAGGSVFTGKVDPATGFLTGSFTGHLTADATAATASGGVFSDGALRNLSTRGQVGTGANVLITGFIIGGSTSKQVLIRAVGPTLGPLGVVSPLADPQLQVFTQAGVPIAGGYNNDWNIGDASAMTSVGAFSLPSGSKDSSLIVTLPPGLYTTQVSGVGGTTGVALVEFYDLDSISPFSSQKVVNVSTRGLVGSGQNVLIAGFAISGTAPKKLLLRAVGGKALSDLGVTGVLDDPFLTLLRHQSDGSNVVVRENDSWEVGNDVALVAAAGTSSGAFPLASGSKDAAMLIVLPPGTYTAQVSGANGGSGIALVEVYEVQ